MKATTIRFSDEMYAQLEGSSAQLGLPINSIVVMACLNWLSGPQAGMLRRPPMRRFHSTPWLQLGKPWRGSPKHAFETFSEAAKQALLLAQEESEQTGRPSIGTEQLLVGLIRSEGGVAGTVLAECGVGVEEARSGLAAPDPAGRAERLLPTSRVKRVCEVALKEARAAGLAYVGTEHLLLGTLVVGEGRAAALLAEHGVSELQVRTRLGQLGDEA